MEIPRVNLNNPILEMVKVLKTTFLFIILEAMNNHIILPNSSKLNSLIQPPP